LLFWASLNPRKIAVTNAADDATIADIDPDWRHSWWSIRPGTLLPAIPDPLVLDGYTQADSSPNTAGEGDVGHVMDVGVADVRDLKTGGLNALLGTGEALVGAATGRDADILEAQLSGEYQIFRGTVAGDLQGNLDGGRERIEAPPTGENRGGAEDADELTSVQGATTGSNSDSLLSAVYGKHSSTSIAEVFGAEVMTFLC
jgi:hypothetical protein